MIPSLVENSPFTIIECLALQLPFLASNIPGISQLVHPEGALFYSYSIMLHDINQNFKDVKEVLFQPDEANLIKALEIALSKGMKQLINWSFTFLIILWQELIYRGRK